VTENPFVETSVVRDIFKTIDLARELKQNAAIVGVPGGGKTRALGAYRSQREGAYLMTTTAVTGNALRDLLRELAEVISIHASGSIADMQRQMFAYDLTGRVLIIDEAQNLKLQAFRELLHLHDFTGLCLIFCGNEEVLKRANTNKGAFAQISRRVKLRAEINNILDDDADRIASAFGVEGMDAYKLVRALGHAYHTDGVVSVLEIARRFVGGKTIKATDIRRACEPFPQYRAAIVAKAARSAVA
jgi:DNA transposition AAA+ family ATPase